eukprot:2947586-Pleurochrysis_carterae.AAC.1
MRRWRRVPAEDAVGSERRGAATAAAEVTIKVVAHAARRSAAAAKLSESWRSSWRASRRSVAVGMKKTPRRGKGASV